MTVKEIAKAVGKEDRSVRNWISKLAENNSVIKEKNSASSPMNPADYTIEEVCQIIEAGMGPDVAGVFMANAKNVTTKDLHTVHTHQQMAELRRAYDRGLISADEYRAGIGLQYPKSDMLDPSIAKQVYAVTCAAIEKKKRKQLLDDQSGRLF